MSASLNTGEKGRWQNRVDSQFTWNISDSSTLGSCRAVLPSWCGEGGRLGGPSLVFNSRAGRDELVRCAARHLLIRVRRGVSRHKPELQQASSSYMCLLRLFVLIGNNSTLGIVIKMPIYKRLTRRLWSLCGPGSMDLLMHLPRRCSKPDRRRG